VSNSVSVRSLVDIYLRQHIYCARIRLDGEAQCEDLLHRMVDAFLVANDGIQEAVTDSLRGFPEKKQTVIYKGWKDKIRKASAAYCEALYVELDLADVFLTANAAFVDCRVVITNQDCILNAVKSAKIIAEKRKRRLYGFGWFNAA
jgi:hypothetical protein